MRNAALPAVIFSVFLVSSCGGGGGGSTPVAPPAPAPTASISSSKANAEKGDSVTLTWSSTNAASCTASGSWNGSIGTSGSQSVTVAAAGNLVYTVTCSSGAQSSSADAKVTAVEKPTASLAVSQSTALADEKISLTWSSSNATSCSLNGELSGAVATSGSKEVSAATAGTKSISISCAGSLSSASASVSFAVTLPTTYTVTTDVTKLSYPSSYKVPTTKTADLIEDPCKLDYSAVTYPQNWMGKYALPPVTGAPLKPSIQRGIFIKDIMLTDNPTFNPGCKGSLKSEFTKLIDRLQKLGVDFVYVPQWHWIGVKPDGSWYVIKAEDSYGPLSDSDLSYFVSAAHAVGIKVLMTNQIQGVYENNSAYEPAATSTNYKKWFAAYAAYIEERSKFFQSIGIDIWELGCSACVYHDNGGTGIEADQRLFLSEYLKLLPILKKSFNGKVLLSTSVWNGTSESSSLYDQVDIVMADILPTAHDNNYRPQPPESFSVASYKSALQAGGRLSGSFTSIFDRPGKSLLFWFGIQSRTNAFSKPGYIEETACTGAIGDLNPSSTTCIQKETEPNFSLQAIFYEAIFESLSTLNLKGTLMVSPSNMFVTDSMYSGNTFPNIAESTRNKPAEGIIKAWYAK